MCCLEVVDSLCTSFYIAGDAVVVARLKLVEIVKTMDSESIFRCIVASSDRVTCNVTLGDVVASLGSNKESVASNNTVRSEGGSLEHVI